MVIEPGESTTQEGLSEREKDILRLVATGASNKEIGAALSISANTVKVHLRNIFAKLGVRSRTEASMAAIDLGLVRQTAPVAYEQVDKESPPDQERPIAKLPHAIVHWWQKISLLFAVILGFLAIFWPDTTLQKQQPAFDPFRDQNVGTQERVQTQDIGRWQEAAQMPLARARFAVGLQDDTLVVIGGDSSDGVSSRVDIYDLTENLWRPGKEKPTAASNIGAAWLDDKLVVPGGYLTNGTVTNTTELYDPSGNTWESGPTLPVPLCAYAIASDGMNVCLFGGWDGNNYLNDVYCLHSRATEWQLVGKLPGPRSHAAAVYTGGVFYILGGYDGQQPLKDVDCFILDSGQWQKAAQMPEARAGLAATTIGDTIYILGGGWNQSLSYGLKLNIGSNNWNQWETPVNGQWRNLGMVNSDTTVIAVGGWDGEFLPNVFRYQAVYRIILPLTSQ